jgi:hypothetical protein
MNNGVSPEQRFVLTVPSSGTEERAVRSRREATRARTNDSSCFESSDQSAWYHFCAPLSAVTTPVEPSRFDAFTQQIQLLRSAPGAESSSSVSHNAKRVSAALNVAYELEANGEARAAAREIMAFVEGFLRTSSIFEPNRLLAEADVGQMSTRSLTGLIRSTFVARKRLPAWERAYARAWLRAKELGREPEKLFVGMPQPAEMSDAQRAG